MAQHYLNDLAGNDRASRIQAIGLGWTGAFCAVEVLAVFQFLLGSQDRALGGKVTALLITTFASAMLATIVAVGVGVGLLFHRKILRRHTKRLNAAAFIVGVVSMWCWLAIPMLLGTMAWEDLMGLFYVVTLCSAIMTFGLVEVLRRMGYIASRIAR